MKPRQRRLIIAWVLVSLATMATLAIMPPVKAGMDAQVVFDGVDAVISISERATGTSTDFDFNLHEWKDLNSDGDMNDANEMDLHVSAADITDCTGAAMNPHFSCDLIDINDERIIIVWRNATAQHNVGNYTIRLQWEDAVQTITAETFISIRIIDNPASDATIISSRESIRAQTQTYEGNETARWQQLNNTVRSFETNESARFELANQTRSTTEDNLTTDIVEHNTNSTNEHRRQEENQTHGAIMLDFGDNQDGVFIFYDPSLISFPATFDLELYQYEDLDNDGSFAGVGEYQAVFSQTIQTVCTGVGFSDHFACRFDATNRRMELVWKKDSTLHEIGNYTMRFIWNNGYSVPFNVGIRVHDPPIGGSTTTTNLNVSGNPQVDEIFKLLGLVTIIALLVLLATQVGTFKPLTSMLLSVAFIGVFWGADLFTSGVANDVAIGAPLIPFIVGAVNVARSGRGGNEP